MRRGLAASWFPHVRRPYSIVASYITAEQAYGGVNLPIFLLAKDGSIVADDARKVNFRISDVHVDDASGKPIADTVVYEYRAGSDSYRVSFNRAETIVDSEFIKGLKGIKQLVAKLAHFDGAYLRFTGEVRLEHLSEGTVVEDVSDPGVWELMYFGHVEQQ